MWNPDEVGRSNAKHRPDWSISLHTNESRSSMVDFGKPFDIADANFRISMFPLAVTVNIGTLSNSSCRLTKNPSTPFAMDSMEAMEISGSPITNFLWTHSSTRAFTAFAFVVERGSKSFTESCLRNRSNPCLAALKNSIFVSSDISPFSRFAGDKNPATTRKKEG